MALLMTDHRLLSMVYVFSQRKWFDVCIYGPKHAVLHTLQVRSEAALTVLMATKYTSKYKYSISLDSSKKAV